MTEYKRGFIDGLKTYAWLADGKEYVGTLGTTLKEAIEWVEDSWNFDKTQKDSES